MKSVIFFLAVSTFGFGPSAMASKDFKKISPIHSTSEPPVRLKNYREIYSSLAEITNVSESDSDMQTTFLLVKDRLPKIGSPQEFSSPSLLALTELSGAFCRKAIEIEKKRPYGERTLFSDINFERGPNQFSKFLNETLSKKLSRIFWQREIKSEELDVFDQLILDSSKEDSTTPLETERVMQIVCTAFGSSLAFATK